MAEDLIAIILRAVTNIDQGYFRLQTNYRRNGIVRERVFCYELYHQIRLLQEHDNPFTLNGEIDKRGHIDFDIKDRVNPDFVFHIPGTHEGNTVVCEVKGALTEGIVKDFRTLTTFISKYNYRSGLFILYNHTVEQLRQAFTERLSHFKGSRESTTIYILTIPTPHEPENIIRLCDL